MTHSGSAFGIAFVVLAYPYVVDVKAWPGFIRFILDMAYYFEGGTAMVVEEDLKDVDVNGPVMLAMAPHGIFCQSFFLNGAARIHARWVPSTYERLEACPMFTVLILFYGDLMCIQCITASPKPTCPRSSSTCRPRARAWPSRCCSRRHSSGYV